MISYSLVEFSKPLQAVERPDPVPQGTEVLVRVRRSGVCHSDVHLMHGYFDFGEDGHFNLEERGMKLPMTLGHEVLGEVVAAGPDAPDAPIGRTMLVHPWIGCEACDACREGRQNDCTKMNAVGILRDGGYATHVIVPHPKFLVDVEGLDLSAAAPLACSGVTVYAALKKALPLREGEWLAVIGAGGLGLNAVSVAKALGVENVISVDHDASKLPAAEALGAKATVCTKDAENPVGELQRIAGGRLLAVVDTVGMEETARVGLHALAKTGRYVVVGLHGGTLRFPLPLFPQKAMTARGSFVGCVEDLEELVALAKAGKVASIPITERPLDQAGPTLEDLEAGRIVGRVVLTAD